jgi:hypothetical protein
MLTPALLGGMAGTLAVLALGAPGLLQPVHKGWMRLAEALGWLNTRVLLSIVYYLMMTPLGVAMRLLGKDPLDRRLHDRASYWIVKDSQGDPKGAMERRF